ncbi:MAG: hypothetical protein JWM32_1869 [Verrucomicrobia bacterium]|nr:hypothetical protein [Verrucomicrobiota bacterium]
MGSAEPAEEIVFRIKASEKNPGNGVFDPVLFAGARRA